MVTLTPKLPSIVPWTKKLKPVITSLLEPQLAWLVCGDGGYAQQSIEKGMSRAEAPSPADLRKV